MRFDVTKYTLSTTPRTMLVIGDRGCGKHLFCSKLAKHLGIELVDITEKIDLETITQINEEVVPKLYIVDTTKLTTKEFNVMLKFIEEPLKNSYVFLLSTHLLNMPSTIKNRCVTWFVKSYTQEELEEFYTIVDESKANIIRKVANTPGKVIEYQQQPIVEMYALCEKILDNIGNATLPNTLTLLDKIAFKDEKDKFNFDIFVELLGYVAYERFIEKRISERCIMEIHNFSITMNSGFNLNKEHLFAKLLIDLRDLMREWNSKH